MYDAVHTWQVDRLRHARGAGPYSRANMGLRFVAYFDEVLDALMRARGGKARKHRGCHALLK